MAIATVGPVPDVVYNTTVLDEWGNATGSSSVGRVVHRFASTAERNAAIPTPVRGMVAVTTDTDSMWRAAGAPATWRLLPGSEYAYAEITAQRNITSTNESAADLVVAAPAVVYPAAPIIVECFAPVWAPATNQVMWGLLYQDGVVLGRLGAVTGAATGSLYMPFTGRRRLTPTAASHTYSFTAALNGGTGTVYAAAGGAGAYLPAFIRITAA